MSALVTKNGARELERAAGKAKAPGRRLGRLERQLARARKGIRRFGRARGEEEGEDGGWRLEDGGRQTRGRRMEDGGTVAATGTTAGMEEQPSQGSGATSPPLAGCGAESMADTAGTESGADPPSRNYGAASGVDGADGMEDADSPSLGCGAASGVDGVDGMEDADSPSTGSGAASPPLQGGVAGAAGEVWNGARARMEVEQWVAEAMQERERAEEQRDKTPMLESRMAAVERRLETLEGRARVSREL